MIKGIQPTLAPAGHIKIGRKSDREYKAKSGNTYRRPEKIDHFLVTTTSRVNGQLVVNDDLMRALVPDPDGKIRQIPIVLHSDDIDTVFPTQYAAYASKQIACRGDGEKASRWQWENKVRLDKTFEVECGEKCQWLKDKKCKPHGILNCSIAIPGHAIAGAIYRWRTTGIISIQRMIGSLQQILDTVGTLRNVPLTLCVQPVTVSPEGRTVEVYSCHVELRAKDLLEVQQGALEARKQRQLLDPPRVRLLPAAPADDNETAEEQADVAEEFYVEAEHEETEEEKPTKKDSVKQAAKETAKKGRKPKAESKPKATKPKAEPKPEPEQQEPDLESTELHEPSDEVPPVDDDEPDYGTPDDEVAF